MSDSLRLTTRLLQVRVPKDLWLGQQRKTGRLVLTCRSVQLCSTEDEMQDVLWHTVQGWLPGSRPCMGIPLFLFAFLICQLVCQRVLNPKHSNVCGQKRSPALSKHAVVTSPPGFCTLRDYCAAMHAAINASTVLEAVQLPGRIFDRQYMTSGP